jgi:hypothetical protein
MKKSEELRIKAGQEESDVKAFGILKKAEREENEEYFVTNYLGLLKQRVGTIYQDPLQRNYLFETEKYGRVVFYPKKDRIHLCKENKWISSGLQWLIKNFELR